MTGVYELSTLSIPYGYIYRIINSINGKTYIGMRKLSLDKRWRQYLGSGVLIKQAINKYGENSFIKEFICYEYSESELSKKEVEIIVLLAKGLKTGAISSKLHISDHTVKIFSGIKTCSSDFRIG